MNTKHTLCLVAVSLLFLTTTAIGQGNSYSAQFASMKSMEKQTAQEGEAYAYSKKIPAVYTGYAIQIAESELPLTQKYGGFQHFGKVYYDKTAQGTYSYLILADFNRRKSIEKYMEDVVKYRAPNAKIVRYKNGELLVKKPKKEFSYMVD